MGKPNVVFIDEDLEDVIRFIIRTDLNLGYTSFEAKDVDPYFSNRSQRFIFVNKSNSEVFYDIGITSAHTSLSQKRFTINEVINLFNTNDDLNNNTK